MYCFHLVEIDQKTKDIVVNEQVFLETNRPAFQRSGRAVGYGRTFNDAYRHARIFVKWTNF